MEDRKNQGDTATNGIRNFIIITPDDFENIRSVCHECGGSVSSRGSEWQCRMCGKRIQKIRRTKEIDRTGFPQCCGRVMISQGINYTCTICGRSRRKIYRRKFTTGLKK